MAKKSPTNQQVVSVVVNNAPLGGGLPVPGFGYPGDAVARPPVPLPEQNPEAITNVAEGGRYYSPQGKANRGAKFATAKAKPAKKKAAKRKPSKKKTTAKKRKTTKKKR